MEGGEGGTLTRGGCRASKASGRRCILTQRPLHATGFLGRRKVATCQSRVGRRNTYLNQRSPSVEHACVFQWRCVPLAVCIHAGDGRSVRDAAAAAPAAGTTRQVWWSSSSCQRPRGRESTTWADSAAAPPLQEPRVAQPAAEASGRWHRTCQCADVRRRQPRSGCGEQHTLAT